MKTLLHIVLIIGLSMALVSCGNDDSSNLPPVDERVASAIDELRDELTDPINGWVLQYSPTDESGIFYMLLDFDENGTVRIQSDVPGDSGAYYDHTIAYRIDYALHLELIFETYGAFHYLFEQDQASFGAEFEFLYKGKDGDNLNFESKSDIGTPSVITLVPNQQPSSDPFSRDIATNMEAYLGTNPIINFGTGSPKIRQQLYFENSNVSLFWAIDINKRFLEIDVAGVGASIEEIESNDSKVYIGTKTGFGYLDGAMILQQPIEFTVGSEQFSITQIQLQDLSLTGNVFCDLNPVNTAVYTGSVPGKGPVQLLKSLYTSEGERFQPRTTIPYSINVLFIFDGEVNSLLEEGSIGEKFPNATAFVWSYGYSSETYTPYSLGFVLENEDGSQKTYLREFEPTTTVGNMVHIQLTDNYIFSETPGPEDEQYLMEITDEIFEGGDLYAFYLTIQGFDIIRLYNPCNNYEILLIE